MLSLVVILIFLKYVHSFKKSYIAWVSLGVNLEMKTKASLSYIELLMRQLWRLVSGFLDSMGCILEWPGLKSDQKNVSEQTLTNQSPDRLSIMAKRD